MKMCLEINLGTAYRPIILGTIGLAVRLVGLNKNAKIHFSLVIRSDKNDIGLDN